MRIFGTAIILTLLGQPAVSGCDFSQPDGFCKLNAGGWIMFTTGEGRFLSEAYCNALGELAAFASMESVNMSRNDTEREEMNDTITKIEREDFITTKSEIKICDLHVVSEGRSESTTSADGSETDIFQNTVAIFRGMSRLTCSIKAEYSPEGDVFVESFDESQNFYADLIHPAKPPACGPNGKLIILESKGIDGGEYWTAKISYRSNVKLD